MANKVPPLPDFRRTVLWVVLALVFTVAGLIWIFQAVA